MLRMFPFCIRCRVPALILFLTWNLRREKTGIIVNHGGKVTNLGSHVVNLGGECRNIRGRTDNYDGIVHNEEHGFVLNIVSSVSTYSQAVEICQSLVFLPDLAA